MEAPIIDETGLRLTALLALETALNQMTGAVNNCIFALRRADYCVAARADGVSVRSI